VSVHQIDIAVIRSNQMANPVSISLSQFTASVQAAVKEAIARHPKFNLTVPKSVSVAYLIRGIPVPEEIASKVTLGETQALATEIAAHLAKAHPEALAAVHHGTQGGAILSVGRHIIIGIPAPSEIIQIEQ
jgi:hypothetical protein